jgi:phenylacetate-coenzyme A ligase PaaK-like adenylate-forming protein
VLVDLDDARRQLLSETLRYAVDKIPFYSRYANPAGVLTFENLPVLTAADIAGNEREFSALSGFPDGILLSGGTSGTPSMLFRSLEEEQLAMYHHTGLAPYERFPNSPGFVLHIAGSQHGFGTVVQANQPLVRMPLREIRHARSIMDLLCHGLVIAGEPAFPIALAGNLTRVKALSSALATLGLDPSSMSRIEEVGVSSSFLTPTWRENLRRYWNAKTVSVYGLSELGPTSVSECSGCGAYHLSDMILWEVLDPVTLNTVSEGCGVLVATTLYPFFSSMLRLRYSTRDIVQVTEGCQQGTSPAVKLIGRQSSSPLWRDASGRLVSVLSMLDVLECLEDLPWLVVEDPVSELFRRAPDIPAQLAIRCGHPRIAISASTAGPEARRIVVGMEHVGQPSDQASAQAAQEARRRLVTSIPVLDEWLRVDGHVLDVQVVDEGCL